jgi:hypothetical protein
MFILDPRPSAHRFFTILNNKFGTGIVIARISFKVSALIRRSFLFCVDWIEGEIQEPRCYGHSSEAQMTTHVRAY